MKTPPQAQSKASPQLPVKRVAAAVIFRDEKILAARRPALNGLFAEDLEKCLSLWEFPGGKIESGESARAAVIREIREELALELLEVQALTTIAYDYPRFHLELELFSARISPDKQPQALFHEELRWLSQDELFSVEWLPSNKAHLAELKRFWQSS